MYEREVLVFNRKGKELLTMVREKAAGGHTRADLFRIALVFYRDNVIDAQQEDLKLIVCRQDDPPEGKEKSPRRDLQKEDFTECRSGWEAVVGSLVVEPRSLHRNAEVDLEECLDVVLLAEETKNLEYIQERTQRLNRNYVISWVVYVFCELFFRSQVEEWRLFHRKDDKETEVVFPVRRDGKADTPPSSDARPANLREGMLGDRE